MRIRRYGWAALAIGLTIVGWRFLQRLPNADVLTTTAEAEANEVTYSYLAQTGRPSHFYEAVGIQQEACDAILGALNKPRPLTTYDMKEVLLGTSLRIDWRNETVSQERRPLPGEVWTSTIRVPTAKAPFELLLWTKDVEDAPVDTLVIFRQPTIRYLRLEDGRIDADAAGQMLDRNRTQGEVVAPLPEWIRMHDEDTDSTPFSASYYWSEVVSVDSQPYVLLAAPPQFDAGERLNGSLDIFVAPVGEASLESLACHFVHKSTNSR